MDQVMPTATIRRTLDIAGVRVAARDLPGAIAALEDSLAALAPAPPTVWHLETVLAALYDRVGRPERARAIARRAQTHAYDARDVAACERTDALLARLAPSRIARGSCRATERG
jgi:hypothetical protein